MLMEKERQAIVDYGNRLITDGLTSGTAGNISIYDPSTGYMVIGPSGIPYADTRPEDVVVMDLNGNIVEGMRKPSSEFGLHGGIYRRRPDLHALVHAHSVYCTTLACMGEPLRSVHYAIADAGVATLPLARYETFGTAALAEAVGEAIGDQAKGLLMANHGMIAGGDDIKSAFGLALTMEWCAQIQWRCMCAGKMNVISDEQMEDAFAKYKTYGQTPGKTSGYNG